MLELTNISKTFPGQVALHDVDLSIASGQVHALVGHNGSGKSTLIKVLSGYHRPDAGKARCRVGGTDIGLGDPDASRRAGIRFLHQDIGLLEGLSVLENLKLGSGLYDTGFGWRIRWRSERADATARLARLGLSHISVEATLDSLSAIEKTEVGIARAVQDEDQVRVLVLDEPTATMPDQQVHSLFELVRRLTDRGVAVLYVSHRLDEVFEIGDVVTVLRDGEIVHSSAVDEIDGPELARLIAGGELASLSPRPAVGPDEQARPILEFRGVRGGRELLDASFAVSPGEIVGLAGLAGSGVHEVPEILLGEAQFDSGSVEVDGQGIERPRPGALARLGVAVLPAAKSLKGILGMSVRENMTLADLSPYWNKAWFNQRYEKSDVASLMDRFGITPRQPERHIEKLSGGNQQKVFVARWVRTGPRILVLDEPTQGVDVRGSAEILQFLSSAAESEGLGVLICSSDLEDLSEVCSRVLIMRHGRVAAELYGDEVTSRRIIEHCYADEVGLDEVGADANSN